MIKIKVRPFFHLKEILKDKELIITLAPDSTALDVIEELTKRFAPSFKDAVVDKNTGKIRPYYRVLLEGRDLHQLEDLNTKLCDGDIISFFPPVAGGNRICILPLNGADMGRVFNDVATQYLPSPLMGEG